jgi:hypothetical protein
MSDRNEIVPVGANIPLSPEERLTFQFDAWEKRGRGWSLYPYPVELEPPFRPFLFHFASSAPVYDDARKPTFFSSLADRLLGRTAAPVQPVLLPDEIEPEPEPSVFYEDKELIEIQVSLSPSTKISRVTMEQFLLNLTYCSEPLSFEVLGLPDEILVQLTCRERDLLQLKQQLTAYFPEAVLTLKSGYLIERWNRQLENETVVIDFGLSREFMLPLKTFKDFNTDPLIGIVGSLSELQEGELGLFQILFQPTRNPWPDSIMRAVTDGDGRSFFSDSPEIVSLARTKVSQPLFAAVIRVAAQSPTHERAWQIAKVLSATLAQFSHPSSNELIPLTNDDYNETDHEQGVLYRHSHRSGLLLNSEELVSFVHLPSESVRSAKLKRETKRTKAAPEIAQGQDLILGENAHAGKIVQVSLTSDQRTRHMYAIGASGTGKSTLLLNCILQDIQNGNGVGVLDPHGDLIERILGHIPESRFSDVVLLDPSDEEYPIGFNILSAHSDLEKNLLSSDFVSVFQRLSTSWGDQMTSVLGNAVLAFLESEHGGTLADLRRFLIEPDFRKTVLKTVRDPEVVYYWQKEFPLLSRKPQGPLLTRLDTFLRPKLIRYMVVQKENKLDFRNIMDEGKIFLAKLAQGAIGEENAYLLGTLIVSKLNQLVLSRQEQRESERRNFYLYIDEFQNFITPSMASILSGARKYRLGLILAHQDLRQLSSEDSQVASSVISNPYTRVCFRLGDQDARRLADGFSFFEAKDLQNLGIGEAICRIERADYDFNLKTSPLPQVDEVLAEQRREQLISLSRQRYATPKAEVEALLAKQRQAPEPERPPTAKETDTEETQKIPTEPFTVKPERPIRKQPMPTPGEPQPLGKGGRQHKYLQDIVKRLAEDKGFRATIEKPVLGGKGSVDVALEKNGRTIACEISVSTNSEQEFGNLQKCLAAGFDRVFLLSQENKNLTAIREVASNSLEKNDLDKVSFFTIEDFIGFLEEEEAKSQETEQIVRGRKVKVRQRALSETEKKQRRKAIAETILQAMRRMKPKD